MNEIQIILSKKDEHIFNEIVSNKLNNNQYDFKDNTLSYISIFSDVVINKECMLSSNVDRDLLEKILTIVFAETNNDVKEFFYDSTLINDKFLNNLLKEYINFIFENIDVHGYIKGTISFFTSKICNLYSEKNSKNYFIFYINLLNNILMFYGYYIDWHKKYKNSTVGFWSQFFELAISVNDDLIKDKFINNYINHLNLNIMDPIYFDNGKNNNNLNIKNIRITFIFSDINLNLLFNEYQNKIKKIDRVLMSIFNEMDF